LEIQAPISILKIQNSTILCKNNFDQLFGNNRKISFGATIGAEIKVNEIVIHFHLQSQFENYNKDINTSNSRSSFGSTIGIEANTNELTLQTGVHCPILPELQQRQQQK